MNNSFNSFDAVIYDLEIRNCIGMNQNDGYKYCGGWQDYEGMGISVLVAFDCATGNTSVYLKDNLDDFRDLISRREYLIGYNSKYFDDKVLLAAGIHAKTTYDLYDEVRLAAGIKAGKRVSGYKLGQVCEANDIMVKGGDGADAPRLWQDRKVGKLINYCVNDVSITTQLFYASRSGPIKDPVTNMDINLRNLFEGKHNGQQKALEI